MATGLPYNGYRYYDSQSGRFISVDLAQADYLNPQSLNRYTYALDNPNRYTDPDGAKLPEAAYDIERVPGASAEKSWEELDKELRDLEDAYEDYSSHHAHPMRFGNWLRMMLGAGSTEPSDPVAQSISKNMMIKLARMENYLTPAANHVAPFSPYMTQNPAAAEDYQTAGSTPPDFACTAEQYAAQTAVDTVYNYAVGFEPIFAALTPGLIAAGPEGWAVLAGYGGLLLGIGALHFAMETGLISWPPC